MSFLNISLQNLHDPKRYEAQIDKMFNKMKERKGVGALFETTQEEVPFFTFGYDRESLAYELAKSLRKEEFQISPPQRKKIKVKNKNKERTLYLYKPLDKIVLSVLAGLLTEIFEPLLNKSVFSYRKGITAKDEVIAICNYIKSQKKAPDYEGVYILQTDIASYSDEINLKENSPFWKILEEGFTKLKIRPTPYQWNLIKEAFRPQYYDSNGNLLVNLKGAPTGSPITTLLYNFFVSRVDYYITNEPTSFYARYSDDIVICHSKRDIVECDEYYLGTYLKAISLSLSTKKTERIFLSPSGKADSAPDWRGTNKISILGYSLDASGEYSLSVPRINRLLEKIRFRIQNTKKLLKNTPLDIRGEVLCRVVNEILDDPQGGNSIKILKTCNDLNQLKCIDYSLAQCIAEALTGTHGSKAFREVPYKKLRSDFGLKSLVKMRVETFNPSFAKSDKVGT